MEEEEGEAGCMSRAAMVTVIHVVDTLEPTQSLPPVAAIPRSVCLCRRPPCVPGRVTVQSATTKEEARHCYRKRRRTKALFTPTHPHPPNIPPAPLITFVGEAWETTWKHKADRTRSNFFCHLIPEMFMFICQRPHQQSTPALRIYHLFRTK